MVELLVVIGIIAMLIGILLPAISAARENAKQIRCGSNLRQIGIAARLYANDWQDMLPAPPDGWRWITTTTPIQLIKYTDSTAYWGVAYLPYLASRSTLDLQNGQATLITDVAKGVFTCPSWTAMSPVSGLASRRLDPSAPGHYGINYCILGEYPRTVKKKIATYSHPSETIFAQDAYEQRLDGADDYAPYGDSGDMLSDFGSGLGNLREWRPGGVGNVNLLGGDSLVPLANYYRHKRKCQVLWLDGHTSLIPESNGRDVPAAWYWGAEKPFR